MSNIDGNTVFNSVKSQITKGVIIGTVLGALTGVGAQAEPLNNSLASPVQIQVSEEAKVVPPLAVNDWVLAPGNEAPGVQNITDADLPGNDPSTLPAGWETPADENVVASSYAQEAKVVQPLAVNDWVLAPGNSDPIINMMGVHTGSYIDNATLVLTKGDKNAFEGQDVNEVAQKISDEAFAQYREDITRLVKEVGPSKAEELIATAYNLRAEIAYLIGPNPNPTPAEIAFRNNLTDKIMPTGVNYREILPEDHSDVGKSHKFAKRLEEMRAKAGYTADGKVAPIETYTGNVAPTTYETTGPKL